MLENRRRRAFGAPQVLSVIRYYGGQKEKNKKQVEKNIIEVRHLKKEEEDKKSPPAHRKFDKLF